MATRAELLDAVGIRYRAAVRVERSRILDEFAAVTGYHRKHAIRLLAGRGKREEKPDANETPTLATLRRRTYGVEVREVVLFLRTALRPG